MSTKYQIGDVVEDIATYRYGMAYVVVKEDKAVFLPYINSYPHQVEPLNEETLPIYKDLIKDNLRWCLRELKYNNDNVDNMVCYCIKPEEIKTECWTPRILGNVKDLVVELKKEIEEEDS